MITHTWQLLVAAVAGWVNKEQRDVIAYIMEENKVLKEQLDKHRGRRRLLLTDDQRRRLAVKAKVIGRRMLREVSFLFTPDTILRWYAGFYGWLAPFDLAGLFHRAFQSSVG